MASIDFNEWEERSKKGQLCGVMGRSNEPTTRCPKCLKHYCYEHLQGHGHIKTDQEVDEDKNGNEKLQ